MRTSPWMLLATARIRIAEGYAEEEEEMVVAVVLLVLAVVLRTCPAMKRRRRNRCSPSLLILRMAQIDR